LSTDLIVGYPSETNEDHHLNVELIKSAQPDIVNITRFSPRPGTKAERATGKVSGTVAKNRSREMTDLRFSISLSKNERKVGGEFKVTVTEKGTGSSMIGRTDNYEQVILSDGPPLGSVIDVEIVGCSPIHLIGKPLE
jgi:tRNA A37 methylthiotransferase MiaB